MPINGGQHGPTSPGVRAGSGAVAQCVSVRLSVSVRPSVSVHPCLCIYYVQSSMCGCIIYK